VTTSSHPDPATTSLDPATSPTIHDGQSCIKRQRAVSATEADYTIRASTAQEIGPSAPAAPTLDGEPNGRYPTKRPRGRPHPNSTVYLERDAFNNILCLTGILNMPIPHTGPDDRKSLRLRQLEHVGEFVHNLLLREQEHWGTQISLEQDLDNAKENIETLELQLALREDLEDLLEVEQDKVKDLEWEKKTLEEEVARLREKVSAHAGVGADKL
jgi:hypothetical protein